jgi:predicted alpha/beta hydrolase family esterase
MRILHFLNIFRLRAVTQVPIAQATDTATVTKYVIRREYTFEKDSPEDKLAQESLVLVSNNDDFVTYTDNGSIENTVLFEDLCKANRKDSNKYHTRHLKRRGLDL